MTRNYLSRDPTKIKRDREFERSLIEYRAVINVLRVRAIAKFGEEANDWFPKEEPIRSNYDTNSLTI